MAVPTCAWHSCFSKGASSFDTTWRIPWTNASLTGNCLLLSMLYAPEGNTVVSVTDNMGQSWLKAIDGPANGNRQASIFYRPNTLSGVTRVTVVFANVQTYDITYDISEWYNVDTIAPLGVTISAIPTGTAIAAGSVTPADNNANGGWLIYQSAYQVSADSPWSGGSFSPGSGFTLLSAHRAAGKAEHYRVQATAAAITPTLVAGTSASWITMAIALKAAAAGTAPPSSRVFGIHHHPCYNGAGDHMPPIQFPAIGNAIVVSWNGVPPVPAATVASITDNKSNTYIVRANSISTGGGGVGSMCLADMAITGQDLDNIAIVLNTSINGGSIAVLYDIVGAATPSFDRAASLVGTQLSSGNILSAGVTPTTPSGVIIAQCGINAHTVSGVVTPGWIFDSVTYPSSDGTDNPNDQCNGWAHLSNTDLTTKTPTWSTQNNPNGVQDWESDAMAIMFAASGGGVTAVPTSESEAARITEASKAPMVAIMAARG